MKTVIEMAREVKATAYTNRYYPDRTTYTFDPDRLEAFAELIRADERSSWPAEMEAMERQVNILTDALADERERMKWDVHSCGPTCKRYACVALAQAKVDENEACAKVADEWSKRRDDVGGYIARNIRARRNT